MAGEFSSPFQSSAGGPVIQAGKETEQGNAIPRPGPVPGAVEASSQIPAPAAGSSFGTGMGNLASSNPVTSPGSSGGGGMINDVTHYLADRSLAKMAGSVLKKMRGPVGSAGTEGAAAEGATAATEGGSMLSSLGGSLLALPAVGGLLAARHFTGHPSAKMPGESQDQWLRSNIRSGEINPRAMTNPNLNPNLHHSQFAHPGR